MDKFEKCAIFISEKSKINLIEKQIRLFKEKNIDADIYKLSTKRRILSILYHNIKYIVSIFIIKHTNGALAQDFKRYKKINCIDGSINLEKYSFIVNLTFCKYINNEELYDKYGKVIYWPSKTYLENCEDLLSLGDGDCNEYVNVYLNKYDGCKVSSTICAIIQNRPIVYMNASMAICYFTQAIIDPVEFKPRQLKNYISRKRTACETIISEGKGVINILINKIGLVKTKWHVVIFDLVSNEAIIISTENKNGFYADPFLFLSKNKDNLYLAVEEWIPELGRGIISFIHIIKNELTVGRKLRTKIQTKAHLSFPYPIDIEGDIHIFPESVEGGYGVQGYVFNNNDDVLKKSYMLNNETRIADSIIFRNDNELHLIGSIDSNNNKDYSGELCSWNVNAQYSALNKRKCLSRSVNQSRNGGLINYKGRQFRVNQIQGRDTYGKGIAISEVQFNHDNSYAEKYCLDIMDRNHSWKIHHLSNWENIFSYDLGYDYNPLLPEFLYLRALKINGLNSLNIVRNKLSKVLGVENIMHSDLDSIKIFKT
jgi:hypothetical protein